MNYNTTQILLDTVKPYFDIENIKITTENTDWKDRPYKSDFVTLIENQDVGFEVFDNEIIVFYFTDHTHFEDYSSDLNEGDPDYVQRAKEFLKQLFTLPIRKYDIFKGKKLSCDKYYFVLSDGTEDFIGGTLYKLCRFLNPFRKKRTEITTWQYDTDKKCFTTVLPWKDNPNAIDTVIENDQCRIEIYEKNGAYTYQILNLEFDDNYGNYYWAPYDNGTISFFDTKEKAIADAKMKAKIF